MSLTSTARTHSLLVMGVDVTAIAASARRGGYQVFSIDFFGDVDLKSLCEESLSIIRQREGQSCGVFERDYRVERLLNLFRKLVKRRRVDGVVLGSGLEDCPRALEEIRDHAPIIGNTPEITAGVRDKEKFFHRLHQLGITHPRTAVVYDLEEALRQAKDVGYPVVVKPFTGFGGLGVRKIACERELEEAFDVVPSADKGVMVQEYVLGVPASVSTLSTSENVTTLSVNEQLLGDRRLGAKNAFEYCGNCVPFTASEDVREACIAVSEKIVSDFGLVGSNGVDVIVSTEGIPFVVEVNPRFQGTLECVERVYGLNVVDAHVEACVKRRLVRRTGAPRGVCTRLILYSPQRSVAPDLAGGRGVRDVPMQGVIIEEGEPLCSIISEGPTRDASLRNGWRGARSIWNALMPYRPPQRVASPKGT
jgi:predicted ATP-grasp superfamily ATP-dependent carboligase